MYIPAKNEEDLIKKAPHGELLQKVDSLVNKTIKEKRHFFDNGRTFSAIAYGRIGELTSPDYQDAGVINVTDQKNYVALYVWTGGDGAGIIEKYADVLPKSARAKGCLYIKNDAFLEKHQETIEKILIDAVKD
jgi:hypothetical protein